jgi:hypothetical protein
VRKPIIIFVIVSACGLLAVLLFGPASQSTESVSIFVAGHTNDPVRGPSILFSITNASRYSVCCVRFPVELKTNGIWVRYQEDLQMCIETHLPVLEPSESAIFVVPHPTPPVSWRVSAGCGRMTRRPIGHNEAVQSLRKLGYKIKDGWFKVVSPEIMPPNKSLQPTPGSAFRSASRFTATGPAWLSLGRSA